MRYRVIVSTPYHGELFEARSTEHAILKILEAAVASAQSVEDALRDGRLPLKFEVEVHP